MKRARGDDRTGLRVVLRRPRAWRVPTSRINCSRHDIAVITTASSVGWAMPAFGIEKFATNV
jgi:hypothetical protein